MARTPLDDEHLDDGERTPEQEALDILLEGQNEEVLDRPYDFEPAAESPEVGSLAAAQVPADAKNSCHVVRLTQAGQATKCASAIHRT